MLRVFLVWLYRLSIQDNCFPIFYRLFFLFWGACVNCGLSFLFIAGRSRTWCGPATSTCGAFRDGTLHTFDAMSDYMSSCRLSVILNQSVHQTWTLARHFQHDFLPFFGSYSVNSRDGCVWKSKIRRFRDTQTSSSSTMLHSKSLQSLYFSWT